MKIYIDKSQFGWPDDNGIGERLILQILHEKKTATASPKVLYSEAELKELYGTVGKQSTVIDKDEQPRCNIQILEVFETTFGSPDYRLVRGEGYDKDVEAFRESHRKAWGDLVDSGKLDLNEDTILIVELFELIKE
jgi:uncharacterized protein YhfF